MSQWICRKCGCEAISKCVSRRNVFIRDDHVAMLQNLIEVENVDEHFADKTKYSRKRVIITLIVGVEENVLVEASKVLRGPDEVLIKASCSHDWRITEGECLFGCHKAEVQNATA